MNRRSFLEAGAAALAAQALAAGAGGLKVSIFSKHLQFLEGRALARAARELGFDAVDLTVRPGGHVEPERVASELPELVRAIRGDGLEVEMVTSGIVDADTPYAEAVLSTLAELGIRYYRWGGFDYAPDTPIPEQLEALKPRVARLARLNERYRVCAMYHTHSGIGRVGASIWDLYLLLKEFDPHLVGVNYDTAHATVEGGFGGWIHSLRLVSSMVRGVAVKDFRWARDARGRWRPEWCPLGEGMVDFPKFFEMLAALKFRGPLQVHYEYPLGGADAGKRALTMPQEEVFAAMKRDLGRLRAWLRAAGLASS
jgi:sugar phosphate isomerase/epimerase